MKTQENKFFIDKIITKYQSLSIKEKSQIDLCVALAFVVFLIVKFYNGGEVFGKFIYDISH